MAASRQKRPCAKKDGARPTAKFFRDVSDRHKAKDAHRGRAAAYLRALTGGNKQSGACVIRVGVGVLSNKGLAEPGPREFFQ